MSSFKNFASMLSDLQQQADGRGTIAGSPIEDFLSIAGYGDGGGGGGSAPLIVHVIEEGTTWTLDATYSDIKSAVLNGTVVLISYENQPWSEWISSVTCVYESENDVQFGVFCNAQGSDLGFYINTADGYPYMSFD